MEKEIWEDVKGYEGLYKVSNIGNVASYERTYYSGYGHSAKKTLPEKAINCSKTRKGYLTVAFCKNGICKSFLVSRLVASAFIPNPHNLPEVNHKDGIKENNSVTNLEWCTRSENQYHAYANNLKRAKRGETHKKAKFTNKQAEEIRNSPLSGYRLAKIYGVSHPIIYGIRNGKTYKNDTGIQV